MTYIIGNDLIIWILDNMIENMDENMDGVKEEKDKILNPQFEIRNSGDKS